MFYVLNYPIKIYHKKKKPPARILLNKTLLSTEIGSGLASHPLCC